MQDVITNEFKDYNKQMQNTIENITLQNQSLVKDLFDKLLPPHNLGSKNNKANSVQNEGNSLGNKHKLFAPLANKNQKPPIK